MELQEKAENAAAQPVEQRRKPRHAVDQEATLQVVNHGHAVQCRVLDLSYEGCRLRGKERFAARPHANVEVHFKVKGIAFRFGGTVQWTDGRNQAGIRFTAMSSRRREELAEVLGEVEEDRARADKLAAEKLAAEALAAEKLAEEKLAADRLAAERLAAENATSEMVAVMRQAAERVASERTEDAARQKAEALVLAEQLKGLPRPGASRMASEPPAKPSKRERRSQLRHNVDDTAQILLVNIRSALAGRIVNLSLGGCRIRTDERFPVGIYTRVEAEFQLRGLPFRVGGVTQAIYDRNTVGIRFLDMSERKREQLAQLIEEIEESREAKVETEESH